MNPFVLFENGVFKMWYAAGDFYEPNCLCYAESKDGILFTKNEMPVLEKTSTGFDRDRVGGCQVLRYKGGYLMFYIGYRDIDTGGICLAYSEDGVNNWRRYKRNPILARSTCLSAFDHDSVYKPSPLISGNKCYLYYNGRRRNQEAIGLAVCDMFDVTPSDFI